MLILAADTSGRQGSIALAQGHPDGSCHILEAVALAGGTFSAQFIPQTAALLAKHGVSKRDLGAFAVASGPGSFTGLRVGLAAVKGLAEVLGKPIMSVSLLAAIAAAARERGRVVAALDAGRGEVYAGEYEVADAVTMVRESLIPLAELPSLAKGRPVITPDARVAEAARGAGLAVEEIERPGSAAIAILGWNKLQRGEITSPAELDANYIRRGADMLP